MIIGKMGEKLCGRNWNYSMWILKHLIIGFQFVVLQNT